MTFCELIASVDKTFRHSLVSNFPYLSCFIYSKGRKFFLSRLVSEKPRPVQLPQELKRRFWGLTFRSPIFNAAGMFKDGMGYELAILQSAGAFLAGTVTPSPRVGNIRKGIRHPFLPYPRSLSSSNWMGLPNPGYRKVIEAISRYPKAEDVPIGLSLAADGMSLYDLETLCVVLFDVERTIVDFVEINESCPNVEHNGAKGSSIDDDFLQRIEFLSDNFLKKRKRNLPVILKLSNDFPLDKVTELVDILVDYEFDGLNFGNTSTKYEQLGASIDESERKAFEFFTSSFGGGVSGLPLRDRSYALTKAAAEYLHSKSVTREFHIIRTGGIFHYEDLNSSMSHGVSLFQWFTGYFENFAHYGHRIYQKFFHL